MNQRAIMVAVLLFVLIVAGMFVFAYLKTQEVADPQPMTEQAPQPVADQKKPLVSRIDAKHYYIDGVHTIAGVVDAPTPCDLLDWNVAGLENGKRFVVSFDLKNNSESCAQVVTQQRFKVGFKGPEDAAIEGRINGENVILNLIPAKEGESPADFELFLKG